ncbi:MAG: ATP-dependent Clp protease proteolytic subunit [Salibacteraceae bacterium]|jgi:membrane-bound serine protease (ClpP class)|nr:ATP-dependent Clp protease proteolytic subunit [Salibacteraceae bacterium]
MTKFLPLICLLLLLTLGKFSQAQEKLVYVFEIKEEIAEPVWRTTKLAFAEAKALDADLIFIELNTYGGAVNTADSIRTAILNSNIPVFVLIQNNAASAGAFISIACDSIFMQPGSVMGAATVVNQNGEVVPDKYQSFMRTKMRATAEQKGRNPNVAEAMVDPDIEVEGVSEKGKVLTLTVSEARKVGFCNGEFTTIEQALDYCGYDFYTIKKQRITLTDKIIGWLISPAVSGILILIIFGGIYFELQTPGIGFPIAAALVAASLYFAPLYLEGLAANWEIAIFFIGLVLIAVELFVIPGFGVAGISGIALAVFGLALSMIGNVGLEFDFLPGRLIMRSLLVAIAASSLSLIGSIFLAVKLFETSAFSRLVLEASNSREQGYVGTSTKEFDLIGKTGKAYTDMRPAGKVEIDGEIYDATAESGFIERDCPVKVISYTAAQIKVRSLN